jgi:F420-0:gamma-glutamyl ligase
MQYIPIKTRRLNPPRDNLIEVLDQTLSDVREKDVLVITSKVVAIDEGRAVPESEFDMEQHLKDESDVIIPRENWPSPITIVHNVMVGRAGADKSNSGDYYTLLPKDPFASAERIHKFLKDKFNLNELGVIISDSRSQPLRYGATGCAIGFWGIVPVEKHAGKEDLFGRAIYMESTNVIDGIVAGANLLMGEVAESTPVVIARDIPSVQFKEGNLRDELFCTFDADVFRVLYERYL